MVALLATVLLAAASEPISAEARSLYDFTLKDIDGKSVSLSPFKGKALLIVNVASRCGFTRQYEGLETLYRRYRNRGLVVLGFPANNFLGQEPGTNEQIKEFCSTRFAVTFPMFAKISVKGRDMHPLYDYLTSKQTNPSFGGPVTWNFNKFLVSRDGRIIGRFRTQDEPGGELIVKAVEAALQ